MSYRKKEDTEGSALFYDVSDPKGAVALLLAIILRVAQGMMVVIQGGADEKP